MAEQKTNKTTGLDSNVASALTYALGPVTGIIFLILEKEDKLVRFHAMQSTITFGALFVLRYILTVLFTTFWGLYSLIFALINLGSLVLWVILIAKAYQEEKFKLPVIGDIAENQLK